MTTTSSLILNARIMTKDQRLIQEIDSSLQSVPWDLATHKQKGTEHGYTLDLNTNSKNFLDSLEKLISLLLTMRNLNSSGLGEPGQILELYCHTVRKLGNTFVEETEDGGWASVKSPDGMR